MGWHLDWYGLGFGRAQTVLAALGLEGIGEGWDGGIDNAALIVALYVV